VQPSRASPKKKHVSGPKIGIFIFMDLQNVFSSPVFTSTERILADVTAVIAIVTFLYAPFLKKR
jgi:hypothetical protein